MRGGHKRIGGGNHLSGYALALQCRDQGEGSVGEKGDVSNPQVLAQRVFQLLVEGTTIGQYPV